MRRLILGMPFLTTHNIFLEFARPGANCTREGTDVYIYKRETVNTQVTWEMVVSPKTETVLFDQDRPRNYLVPGA